LSPKLKISIKISRTVKIPGYKFQHLDVVIYITITPFPKCFYHHHIVVRDGGCIMAREYQQVTWQPFLFEALQYNLSKVKNLLKLQYNPYVMNTFIFTITKTLLKCP
jgi:hypothetical protein